MIKIIIFIFLFMMSAFSDTVKDSLEIKLEIKPVFSLSIETFMEPFLYQHSADELLKPSKNNIVPGKNLNGKIDLGYLIAVKNNLSILPLKSEYKVLMKIKCETNKGKSYIVTQTLEGPLTGIESGEAFPENAFVYIASINKNEGNLENGQIMVNWEAPIKPRETEVLYKSNSSGTEYLGNVLDVRYWISDQQEDKVLSTQRADTYKSTLTITMVEF